MNSGKKTGGKAVRILPIGWLVAATVFLMNPAPMLVDVLPDVFAYLFILIALRRVSRIWGAFDEASRGAFRLMVVSVAKIPALLLMFMIWGGDTRQSAIVPSLTLTFAILELVYLLPAIRRLFEAFDRLRTDGGDTAEGQGSLEKLTLAFFIFRAIMGTLPEMCLVPYQDSTGGFPITIVYPIFAALAAILVMVFGACWGVRVIRALRRLDHREETQAVLRTLWEQNAPQPGGGERTFRLLRLASFFWIAGIFCTLDLYFDGINYLPDLLAAGAFFVAGYVVSGAMGAGKATCIATVVYGLFTTAESVLEYQCVRIVTEEETLRILKMTFLAVSFVSEALLVLLCILFCRQLYRIADRFLVRRDRQSDHLAEMTRGEIKHKSFLCTVFGILMAVVSFVYRLTDLDCVMVPGRNGWVALPRLDWFWQAVWAAGLVWLAFSLHTLSRFRDEIEPALTDRIS